METRWILDVSRPTIHFVSHRISRKKFNLHYHIHVIYSYWTQKTLKPQPSHYTMNEGVDNLVPPDAHHFINTRDFTHFTKHVITDY